MSTLEVKGRTAVPRYAPFQRCLSRNTFRIEMKQTSVKEAETRASLLQDLIEKKDIDIYVRDAKGLDGTFVAQLRCMAFDLVSLLMMIMMI